MHHTSGRDARVSKSGMSVNFSLSLDFILNIYVIN